MSSIFFLALCRKSRHAVCTDLTYQLLSSAWSVSPLFSDRFANLLILKAVSSVNLVQWNINTETLSSLRFV